MFQSATPVLHVQRMAGAEAYYRDGLGFRPKFRYRPDETRSDPCYLGLVRDGAELHLSSFSGDGVSGGVVYLRVDDVDALYQELMAKGIEIALEPTDQTWNNREMYVKDIDGNSIRFVCGKGA